MQKEVHKNAMFRAETEASTLRSEICHALAQMAGEKLIPFRQKLEQIERLVTEHLLAADFPDPHSLCLTNGEVWSPLPEDWEQRDRWHKSEAAVGATVMVGWAYIKKSAEPLSDIAVMAEISMQISVAKNSTTDAQLNAAFCIGRLLHVISSMVHLPMVERGKDNKSATRRGGKETGRARKDSERRARILQRMEELIADGHTVSRAAQIAAREGIGTSKGANKQIWYRHKTTTSDL